MRATRSIGATISVLAAGCAVFAALAQEVHYSPEEDLASDVLGPANGHLVDAVRLQNASGLPGRPLASC